MYIQIGSVMAIKISQAIKEKLHKKHAVCETEVVQCFENKCGMYLMDEREDHKTDPPTLWFVAETNQGRILKVVFMFLDGNIHIKTAYEANKKEIAIYEQKGK